jgi:hypothetical protein
MSFGVVYKGAVLTIFFLLVDFFFVSCTHKKMVKMRSTDARRKGNYQNTPLLPLPLHHLPVMNCAA